MLIGKPWYCGLVGCLDEFGFNCHGMFTASIKVELSVILFFEVFTKVLNNILFVHRQAARSTKFIIRFVKSLSKLLKTHFE